MPQVNDFTGLAMEGLREIYDAEQKALKAYPQMIEAASTGSLKDAFREHQQQTQGQIQRLQQIFQKMGQQPEGVDCKAIDGLIADAQDKVKMIERGPLLDAALIAAAQKVEHLEIAAYGTARTLAQQLGDNEAVQLLQATLEEEELTDKKLTGIAESTVNPRAAQDR